MEKFIFLDSVRDFLTLLNECVEFERVYNLMDKKGFLASLQKHNRSLSNYIHLFKNSTNDVLFSTKDITIEMRTKTFSAPDFFDSGSEAHDKILPILMETPIKNLFSSGEGLKRELERVV